MAGGARAQRKKRRNCGLLFTSAPLLNLSQKGGGPGICTHTCFESRVVSVFGRCAGVPGKHYRLLRAASCGGARGTLHGIPLVHGDPRVDGPEGRPEELSGQMRSWLCPPPPSTSQPGHFLGCHLCSWDPLKLPHFRALLLSLETAY